MTQRLSHPFPVGEDALWRGLRASLHRVTTHASFWEHAHRVAWSSDATTFAWRQIFVASVEAGRDGTSILTLSGKSPVRPSFGDRARRATIFQTLVDAVAEGLSSSAATAPLPNDDRVRYWNGNEWTVEPPPDPS